jgi:hypothetical protein
MSLKRKEYQVNDRAEKATRFFIACKANPTTKVKVAEAMQVREYSDLEAKETTNMTGRRRGLPPFEAIKMRTEEELAACGGGGAQCSDSHSIGI